jgi:2-dehydro-3-deoxyphosphogluconate aldolase / (4S)-4-hydroxy-2-oxoglutarate aldolase
VTAAPGAPAVAGAPARPLTVDDVVSLAPVIAVVVIDDLETAVPLATALVAGGLPAIEVTLRTPAAPAAIRAIADEVPGAVVGAGTVTTAAQVEQALAAGARFLVSPGATPALLDALQAGGAPFLPGTATASDVIALLERGITAAKLFPAEACGGIATLRALSGPFPQVRFCPTGGIDAAKAPAYLALKNVICVGGSWMLPKDAILAGDWDVVERLAREAAALSA